MQDILKQFTFSFSIDNKQLKQGIKETQSSLSNLASNFKRLVGAYFTYSAFSGMLKAYNDLNIEIGNASDLLGINAKTIGILGNAIKRFGGDTSSATNALKSMQNHLENAKQGGGALVDIASRYGISINAYQKADKALFSLAKQMQGYSHSTKIAIMQSIGLDEAMQRAFLDGGKELERQIRKQEALGVATENDIQISRDFNNAILDLKDIFSALTRELMRGIVPILKGFVDMVYSFVEFLRKHQFFVKTFFVALAIALSPILLMLAKMAIASLTAFAPFYAIGAVITTIALIFEDLYGYFMGWDSATGQLVDKFPLLKKPLEMIKPIVLGIVKTFERLWAFLKNPSWKSFGDIFKEIEATIKGAINSVIDFFVGFFDFLAEQFPALAPYFNFLADNFKNLKDLVFGLWEAVKDFFKALFEFNFEGMINALKKAIDVVIGFFKNAWGSIKNALGSAWDWLIGNDKKEAPQASPQVPQSVANTSNTMNQNININQNITSPTPQQLANGFNNAVSSVNSQRRSVGSNYE